MCKYIEALYKKGVYLASWGEHFDKNLWFETAKELGFDLEELANKQYDLNMSLPWDFIDVGLDKKWLVGEYKAAYRDAKSYNETDYASMPLCLYASNTPTCESQCVNCGVCKNLNTRKVTAKPFKASEQAQILARQEKRQIENLDQKEIKETFRYRIKLTKTGILKYFSHLDWQNTFLKALQRTDLEVAYSYGYNPKMKVSMGIALPLFCESTTELVDINLVKDTPIDFIKSELKRVLPAECEILNIEKTDKSAPSIEDTVSWALYKIKIFDESLYDFDKFVYNTITVLNSDEILIGKKTKKGFEKTTDYKHSIGEYWFDSGNLFITLKTGNSASILSLRADALMNTIAPDVMFEITRVKFFTEELHEL